MCISGVAFDLCSFVHLNGIVFIVSEKKFMSLSQENKFMVSTQENEFMSLSQHHKKMSL
jgi:hypothetical protein